MRIGIIGAGHAGVEAACEEPGGRGRLVLAGVGVSVLSAASGGAGVRADGAGGDTVAAAVLREHQHGRSAGDNAIAFLQGQPLAYVPEPVSPLSFKHSDIEFHSVGRPAGGDLEEKTLSDDGKHVYRSVLLENGALRGAQMIGSHENFRQPADSLGRTWQGAA